MNERRQSNAALPTPGVVAIGVAAITVAVWIAHVAMDSQIRISSSVFVARDVAAVYFLCALPFALFVVVSLQQRKFAGRSMLIVFLMLVIGLPRGLHSSDSQTIALIRTLVALTLAIAAVSLMTSLLSHFQWRGQIEQRPILVQSGIAILLATIVPAIHVHARCHHGASVVDELLEQSRYGEALVPMRELVELAPAMQWRGRSVNSILVEIDRHVRKLESQIAIPETELRSDEQRLLRCRQLAALGRTQEALVMLAPLLDSRVGVSACDLCGVIHETMSQWATARDYHRRSKDYLLGRPSAVERQAGILRAATRIAYCERKLGHYDLAETQYREVLELAPTAETHFLLARFYEDMQQSAKAHTHARLAMALAPQRYGREGAMLINKLVVGHFGCLNVVSSELANSP